MSPDENLNSSAEDDLQGRQWGLVARRHNLDRNHRRGPAFAPSSSAGRLLGSHRYVPLGQGLPPGIKRRFGNLPLRAPLPHAASAPPPSINHFAPILLLRRTPLGSLRHRSPLGLKSKPRLISAKLSEATRRIPPDGYQRSAHFSGTRPKSAQTVNHEVQPAEPAVTSQELRIVRRTLSYATLAGAFAFGIDRLITGGSASLTFFVYGVGLVGFGFLIVEYRRGDFRL